LHTALAVAHPKIFGHHAETSTAGVPDGLFGDPLWRRITLHGTQRAEQLS
jgi:hypothetical protein